MHELSLIHILEHNQRIIADFGKQQGNASWQYGEFKAANGVKFLACGRGQSPRCLLYTSQVRIVHLDHIERRGDAAVTLWDDPVSYTHL